MDNDEPFNIPQSGKEQLQIGNLNFEFIEEQCKASIHSSLVLTIAAKTIQNKDGQKPPLAKKHNLEEGTVKFALALLNICQQGVPAGEIIFTENSTSLPHHRICFNMNGMQSGLLFNGKVTLKNGWLGIDGVLKPRGKNSPNSPNWPIKASKKIAYDQLIWTQYKFSLQEAEGMSPDLVTAVYVDQFEGTEFPERVFQYKDLTHLWLSSKRGKNTIGVTQLSDAIGELNQLKNLSLKNTNIQYLPSSLFKLPNLVELSLKSNALLKIPDNIDLPKLRSVYLSDNQLTTLPESLALQPNLYGIDLQNNPWQSLPGTFTKIEYINMTAEDKLKFLSKDYPGVDHNAKKVWDENMYFARSDAELLTAMQNAIKDTPLEKHLATFEETALKAVCINTNVPDNYSIVGNTRFGGLPDLPLGVAYPTWDVPYMANRTEHLSFFAQLNCEELAPCQSYLPRTGMLYFFIKEEEEYDNVVWYHPNTDGLSTGLLLEDMDFNNSYRHEPYKPCKAEIRKLAALPVNLGNKPFYEHETEAFKTGKSKAAFHESLGRKGVLPENSNEYSPHMNHSINDSIKPAGGDTPQAEAASKLGGRPEDWTILLRLYSDRKCGFNFYDAGELYFVIHKNDLAKHDFSKVFSFADSS